MLFQALVNLWLPKATEESPARVDVLVPLSYGATEKWLTPASKAIISKTLSLLSDHPNAFVVFGAVKNGSCPEMEFEAKRIAFSGRGVFAGFFKNKIEEARKFREVIV